MLGGKFAASKSSARRAITAHTPHEPVSWHGSVMVGLGVLYFLCIYSDGDGATHRARKGAAIQTPLLGAIVSARSRLGRLDMETIGVTRDDAQLTHRHTRGLLRACASCTTQYYFRS